MHSQSTGRRRFLRRALAAGGALVLSGCDQLSRCEWFTGLLGSAEKLTFATQRLLLPRKAMAQEFTEADLSPSFRSNGTSNPANPIYQALAANLFVDYRLQVGGLVAKPRAYSLEELKAMPSRTQITRHDCVEGWSAIGKWKGVPLGRVLEQVEAAFWNRSSRTRRHATWCSIAPTRWTTGERAITKASTWRMPGTHRPCSPTN